LRRHDLKVKEIRLLTRNCKSHRFTRLSEKRPVGFLWRPGVALSGAGR
jgi:hypothetical protein